MWLSDFARKLQQAEYAATAYPTADNIERYDVLKKLHERMLHDMIETLAQFKEAHDRR